MYCDKCGLSNPDGATYCNGCGQKIGQPAEPQANASNVSQAIGTAAGKLYEATGAAADKLYEVTGGAGHAKLKFREFFTGVFKHHSREEAEELFICGTSTTNPDIKKVSSDWPRPWVWSRVLLVLLVVTVLLCFADALAAIISQASDGEQQFGDGVTGALGNGFIGAMIVPFSIMIFFFETNIPRNISLAGTVAVFLIGGITALIVVSFMPGSLLQVANSNPGSSVIGAMMLKILAGFVMETSKVIVIVIVLSLRGKRGHNYILNGMLIGAAVGAGFLFFSSVADMLLNAMRGVDSMYSGIFELGLAAFGGHVAWGAAEGAVLALVNRKDEVQIGNVVNPISLAVFMLSRPAFLVVFVLCVVLDGAWLFSFGDQAYLNVIKDLVLTVVVWIIIMVLLNRGLDEINEIANKPSESQKPADGGPSDSSSASAKAQPSQQAVASAAQEGALEPDGQPAAR